MMLINPQYNSQDTCNIQSVTSYQFLKQLENRYHLATHRISGVLLERLAAVAGNTALKGRKKQVFSKVLVISTQGTVKTRAHYRRMWFE
jgi:hypothetical protein